MRVTVVAVPSVLVLGLALVGCAPAAEAEPSPPATTSPTATAGRALGVTEANASLLAQEHLPPGWTSTALYDLAFTTYGQTAEPEDCVRLLQAVQAPVGAPVTARRMFENESTGQVITTQVTSGPDVSGDVAASIAEIEAGLADCPSFTATSAMYPEVAADVSVWSAAVPELGDTSVAVHLTSAAEGVQVSVDTVLVVVGSNSLYLSTAGGTPVDAAEFAALAAAAVDRVVVASSS